MMKNDKKMTIKMNRFSFAVLKFFSTFLLVFLGTYSDAQNATSPGHVPSLSLGASLDWQKVRFENILNEKIRTTLNPLLGESNFVFSANVRHRAPSQQESQIRANGGAGSSLAFDAVEDSVLLGRLGVSESVFSELLENKLANKETQESILDYVVAIEADLIIDSGVSKEKVAHAAELTNKIIATYYKRATKVEAKREMLREPPPSFLDRLINRMMKVSLPLAAIIMLIGAAGLLYLAKKMPSTEATQRHKIELEHARRKRAVVEKIEKEKSAPQPDGPNDYALNKELNERMKILCTSVSQDVITVLVEKWHIEGESGWKKGIFVAKSWNEIRPGNPVRLQSSEGLLELFRNLSLISYRERNIILESAIHDIIAVQSLGPSVFEEKFGFLLSKSFEVQVEAFKQLDSRAGQLAVLTQLPDNSKTPFLNELQPEDREELFNDLLTTKFIGASEVESAIFKLKQSVTSIEKNIGSPNRIDLSTHRIAIIQSLSVQEELALLPKMMIAKPALREWLKLSYFGLSLFSELKPNAVILLTKDLNNNKMVDLLLALPDEVSRDIIASQPKLKAAVVEERYGKARADEQKANWTFLNEWITGVRTNLKAKENFKYKSLYKQVDEDLAKTVDSGSDIDFTDDELKVA